MFMHLSPKERFGYVALLAIFLAGGGFVLAQKLRRPASVEIHETPQPHVEFDHGNSKPSEMRTPRTATSSNEQIVVHVAGAVNHPGLVTLPAGARVYDAIREAGGPTPDAVIDQVNLAAKAIDGTQIYVPRHGTSDAPNSSGPSSYPMPSGGTSPNPPVTSRGKHPFGIVDINSADASILQTLPGIGSSMAQRIVDYRTEHGNYRVVDDLLAVQGFGKKRLDQVRQWLTAY